MDCSPPGSSVHGIFQARNTGVVAILFLVCDHLEDNNRAHVLLLSVSSISGKSDSVNAPCVLKLGASLQLPELC